MTDSQTNGPDAQPATAAPDSAATALEPAAGAIPPVGEGVCRHHRP